MGFELQSVTEPYQILKWNNPNLTTYYYYYLFSIELIINKQNSNMVR